MSLPFIKVRTSEWLDSATLIRWDSNMRAPAAWVDIDLAVLTATGRLQDLSIRDLAKRWGWAKSTVSRKLSSGVGQIWDSSGTEAGQQWDTSTQGKPGQSAARGTAVGQRRDSRGTHARSSLENRRGEETREQQQGAKPSGSESKAAGPPAPEPKPPPKKPTARDQEAQDGLECLRTLRGELHEQAMGRKPRPAWATGDAGKALTKRVARFLGEVRAGEVHPEPLQALEALARWAYQAPRANWLRQGPDPLNQALGGKANDPASRMGRAEEALAWIAGGQRTQPRARGSGGGGSGCDWRDKRDAQAETARLPRRRVNQPDTDTEQTLIGAPEC